MGQINELISGRLYRQAMKSRSVRVLYLAEDPGRKVVLAESVNRRNFPLVGRFELAGAMLAAGIGGFWLRRRMRRLPSTSTRGEGKPLTMPIADRSRPEAGMVSADEAGMCCIRPDGSAEMVRWDDLETIWVETTEDGPFAEDVFFVLQGREAGCVVPQGARGTEKLLAKLQQLPGFDNETFIEAMGTSENARFLCWRREESSSEAG